MPAVSTRVHAYLHYAVAIILLLTPVGGGFAGRNPETWVALASGIALIAYGLLTDYELGVVKWLQMPLHLWIDALGGIVVATSPWVLSFDERVWIPHLAVGLVMLALAIGSQTIPGYERRSAARSAPD